MSTEVFVEQLYTKFLFRTSDEAGKKDWINRIEGGELSPAEVTYNFAISQEYSERASAVSSLYFLLFGRVPDSDGMQYWLDKVDQGMSTDDLVDTFTRSQEYHDKYGSAETDSEFLPILINNGFNRDVNESDELWLDTLSETEGRAAVIRSIASSDEMQQIHGQKIQQTSLYYGVLDRAPTDEELAVAPEDPVELINALYSDGNYEGEPLPVITPLPVISIAADQDAINESDTTVTFTVTRSEAIDSESSVVFEVSSSSATAGEDFSASNGNVTFAPGETTKQISVQVLSDNAAEANESINVRLSTPQNAELSTTNSSAGIDIIDDDGLAPVEIATLVESHGVTFDGTTPDGRMGSVLSAAGDINGDGYADFIVGSDDNDHQANYLIFGSAHLTETAPDLSSLDGSNGFQILGNAPRVDAAGDINGDGYDDLILGNPTANETGQSYLIFGKADGWSSSVSLSELDGKNGVLINGISAGDDTGDSVAGAGDINGDGIDDLVIGSPSALKQDNSPYAPGQIHVIYGHRGDWDATFDLAQFDSSQAATIVGQTDNPLHLGYTLNGVGDMNGDGIDDLMVMEGGFFGRYAFTTFGYLIFGRSEGWDTPFFIGERDATDVVKITVSGAQGRNPIQSPGDVNGDGIADMLIGRPTASGLGGTSLVFGQQDGNWPTELGADDSGYISIVDEQQVGRVGVSIAGIGDINQDGFADLMVGQAADPNGYAYLLYGRAEGWDSSVNLSEVAKEEGELIKLGEQNEDVDLAGVGDVNGDGYADFLIGEPGLYRGASDSTGQAHLIFGNDQLFA